MTQVSIDNAASIIGVSTATIRNWVKAGHLNPTKSRPIYFSEAEVIDLKTQISSGQLTRLRSRANKTASTARLVAPNSADATPSMRIARQILNIYHRSHLNISATMYFCALRQLELTGEVSLGRSTEAGDFGIVAATRRSAVGRCLREWQGLLSDVGWNSDYYDIQSSIDHVEDDLLGIIYQLLSAEGDRSNKGAYYTPMNIVAASLLAIEQPPSSFVDHCCGSGRYLIAAARIFNLPPSNIYGFDTDRTATQIAKINFLLQFPTATEYPNIECLDGIADLANGELICSTHHMAGTMACVATNPPWGSYKNSTKNSFSQRIVSNEAFSLFLEKGIHLLRDGGSLSFILPESILKTKTHQDIRRLILETSKIQRIVKLGRAFGEVFTNAIRVDLIKGKANPGWELFVESGEKVRTLQQQSFSETADCSFDIDIESTDDLLLKKLYSTPHLTLKGNSDWALGIVTGNNAKYVSDKCEEGMEPVFRGSDILAFGLKTPSAFLRFMPNEFQQVAKQNFYRAPVKLIYKFISSRLAFAFDDKQRLTLNSANILIPRIDGLGIKTTLAILNSDVFQYIFKKKFSTHKVLRGDLETMPFPIVTPGLNSRIEALVDDTLDGKPRLEKIQEIVFSLFSLDEGDVAAIKKAIGN